MSQPFYYQHTFILDKAYFNECFDASVTQDLSFKAFSKAIVFVCLGMFLTFFTDMSNYASSFIFALGIVEALSVYYKKPWWVIRQNLSRAANNDVTITIDDTSIIINSNFVKNNWQWQNIEQMTFCNSGWLITFNNTRYYLSKRCLSDEAVIFVENKANSITDKTVK